MYLTVLPHPVVPASGTIGTDLPSPQSQKVPTPPSPQSGAPDLKGNSSVCYPLSNIIDDLCTFSYAGAHSAYPQPVTGDPASGGCRSI